MADAGVAAHHPAMQPIVDFILELDKLKGVTRKVRPLLLDRYENSIERYADSDVPPDWFDPAAAGERWDDD